MSEVKRYRFVDANGYPAARVLDNVNGARYVAEQCFDAAQFELAASKNREMALLSSIETANADLAALREELAELEDQFDTLEHSNTTLKLKLSAAEQRNVELERDARRYGILRGGSIRSDDNKGLLSVWDWRGCSYEELGVELSGEKLDETLDAYLSGASKLNYYNEQEAMSDRLKPTESGASE